MHKKQFGSRLFSQLPSDGFAADKRLNAFYRYKSAIIALIDCFDCQIFDGSAMIPQIAIN
jgi:hypothetical protein